IVPEISGFILVLSYPIVELESVDGMAPSDPKHTYGWTLENDTVTITITKNTGQNLTISVQTSQPSKVQKATWIVPHGGSNIDVDQGWLDQYHY
ncbi:MAG: hypothetical protein KGI28_10105, partial [Thaumarchaeota archaeon]|nr:hypothetical protein [Nitrososphaerota archaeon]